MSNDDFDYGDIYEPEYQRPRDSKVDEVKTVLLENVLGDGDRVFYGRQLEILLEKRFFHWITKKGLNELVQEGEINFCEEKFGTHTAHFYWPRRHRYARRAISATMGLIAEFSDPSFTRALGQQGESLADVGFAHIGFRIRQSKVREVDGTRWVETDHDLDRLIERDGERYGVEIKNQLGYIDQAEFEVKMRMCAHLGVRPMFVARMMPKNYIYQVQKAGGFALILGNQHYPLLAEPLAKRVRAALQLPVLSIRKLPDKTLQRFERWHEERLKGEE